VTISNPSISLKPFSIEVWIGRDGAGDE